nr:uncharacterized protein LOC112795095 [Arachis hypogaea]
MAPMPGYSYPSYRVIPTNQMAQPSGIAPGRLSLDTRPRQLTLSESYQPVDEDNDDFLVDHLDGDEVADEDDDEDDDEDEADGEDDDDGGDGPDDGSVPTVGTTTSEKEKGYNLRADPPRQSASRYTLSTFKKVAKKCKKLVKDVKWAMRK